MSNNMTEFTRRRLMFAQTQGVSVESRDCVHVVVCMCIIGFMDATPLQQPVIMHVQIHAL